MDIFSFWDLSLILLCVLALFGSAASLLLPGRAAAASVRSDEILLVSVQMSADPEIFLSPRSFRDEVMGLMEHMRWELEPGSDTLVVFPENVGLLTVIAGKSDYLEQASTLEEGLRSYFLHNIPELIRILWLKFRRGISINRALFLRRQEVMADLYFDTFSEAARSSGVYLVAGSGAFSDRILEKHIPPGVPGASVQNVDTKEDAIYNVSVVFDPEGEVIGLQRKVHLTELEGPQGLDLTPGSIEDLEVIPTPLGKLGIALCFDAFYPDVLEVLAGKGTEIIIQPSANPVPWEPWQQLEWTEGIMRAVRDFGFSYGINPMLSGDFFEFPFAGQSSVLAAGDRARDIAPRKLGYIDTPTYPEFVAVHPDPEKEGLIWARVPHPSE